MIEKSLYLLNVDGLGMFSLFGDNGILEVWSGCSPHVAFFDCNAFIVDCIRSAFDQY